MHRCQFQQQGLTEACNASLKGACFDLVICHNVLHLFNGDQQSVMLRQLAALTSNGGTLLVSAYSEPEEASLAERLLAIGPSAFARSRPEGGAGQNIAGHTQPSGVFR